MPKGNPGKLHSTRLVIGLVEFHKAQCYFSSVIQITALTLFHNVNQSTPTVIADTPSSFKITAGTYQDEFDTSVLFVLASSGIIPVSLVLACITRYGRQSWYLLILSWIAITLATATLICCYKWTVLNQGKYANDLPKKWEYGNRYGAINSCDLLGNLNETVIPLCGSSKLLDNALGPSSQANWWAWLIWANCIIWMFYCLGKKCYSADYFLSSREKWRTSLLKHSSTQWIAKQGSGHRIWILASIVPWSLCSGSQFYLFSAYFEHHIISQTWSFGQIIAITVWVPSIVEYLYIELSKCIVYASFET